jgi:hypothetical protein
MAIDATFVLKAMAIVPNLGVAAHAVARRQPGAWGGSAGTNDQVERVPWCLEGASPGFYSIQELSACWFPWRNRGVWERASSGFLLFLLEVMFAWTLFSPAYIHYVH